ncbi:MAG: elongation factor G, partial [Candidatus Electrothrix sp. LOE2]|nr:elongation factor G [Candidatus Electrothrix sp. LOE2]
AFKEGYKKAGAVIMEPIMKVAVEGPSEFQGAIMGSLNQRRGMIVGTSEEGSYTVVEADMPLSEMFGYSTTLRSLTQGKAEFAMEFSTYKQVPKSVSEQLIKEYEESRKNG